MKAPVLNKVSSLQLFQVFRFGAPFMVSVILVRLINQHGIGIYESLTLIGTSFTFFWVTGSINTFIPYYHIIPDDNRPVLIFNVYVLFGVLSLLCFLILLALSPLLNPLSGNAASVILSPGGRLYLYYLIYNLFNAPSFLMEYLLLLKNRSQALVIYGIAISTIQVFSISLPLFLGYSLEIAVLFLSLSSAMKFCILTVFVFRNGKAQISTKVLKTFVAKSLPAALTLVVGGSMPYIDSYIALSWFNKNQFAIYSYGAREMPLVALMANALSNVFSGEIAKAHVNQNITESFDRLKKSSKRLMNSLFPITIILIISSRFLFKHVYSNDFLPSAQIFNAFMLLTISRLVFPQTILMGLMKNRTLLLFNSMEWVINLALDFVFIWYFGLIGIAYATVLAYFFEKAVEIAFLNRIGYKARDYIPLKTWAIYSFATIFAWLASTYWLK